MLTQTYRPKNFDRLVGQQEASIVMKSVANDPDTSPRTYIFHGPRGLGKTSMSRVFARTLLCQNKKEGDACLECKSCKDFSVFDSRYYEYDATHVGNVQFTRQLSEQLTYSQGEGYRIVVFDEIQAASNASQGALLKLFEEGPFNTFFVMATTDIEKVIDTIQSRSIVLPFYPVGDKELIEFLNKIAKVSNILDYEAVIPYIVMVSSGIVREALMKLDLYKQIGDKDKFLQLINMPEEDIIRLFLAITKRDKDSFAKYIQLLSSTPLAYLRKAFDNFILCSLKRFVGEPVFNATQLYDLVVEKYKDKLFNILYILSSDWVYNTFKSDLSFQCFCWYLYYNLSKTDKTKSDPLEGRFRK